jgi:hypothetical protein
MVYNAPNGNWDTKKTHNDPCPPSYRVPDGGTEGVWAIAEGGMNGTFVGDYDFTNIGINFSNVFGNDSIIWYPMSGVRFYDKGVLSEIGFYAHCWSASIFTDTVSALGLYLSYSTGHADTGYVPIRASGLSVRCLKITD